MAQGVIRGATLAALTTNFDYRYNKGITRARTNIFWPKLADKVVSSTRSNIYPFVADIQGMKEWVGPRVVQQLRTRVQTLVNKDYEDTIAVPRNDILDDQYNVYGVRAELLGYQAEKLPDDLMVGVIQNGGSSKSITYDGVPFFSTSHPVDIDNAASPTQSNLFVNTDLTTTNWNAVRTAFRGFKTDSGRVMGYVPDTIFVPPQLEKQALDVVTANLIAVPVSGSPGGAAAITNTLMNTAKVVVIPELFNDPYSWYPAVTDMPIKPLIWQERQAPQMQALIDPQSKNVFMDKEFVWGVDSRGAAGYGMWFLMARATSQSS